MRREFGRFRTGVFDLMVLGGGIYGAWVAYDAALRGLRVALAEKSDWAAGTSSASSKLIHGGPRYPRAMRLSLVRRTLLERRRLWKLGSHRVQPVPFLLPIYAGRRLGRLRLRAGLWLYHRLGGRDQPGPRHAFLRRGEMKRRYPLLDPAGLKGGFLFGDCVTDDARLVLEIIDGAATAGAAVLNGVEAVGFLKRGNRIAGAAVKNLETGEEAEVQARMTVNCTGPWSRDLVRMARPSSGPLTRLSRGVHLVMPALPVAHTFFLPSSASGRAIFMIPWYGRTLLGTTEADYHGPPDGAQVEASDVAYLLEEANRVLQDGNWSEQDVVSRFAGLRTLPISRDPSPSKATREFHLEEPVPGLVTPVGGELTSARMDAERIVTLIMNRLGRKGNGSTGHQPLPWAPPEPFQSWFETACRRGQSVGLDPATSATSALRYGKRVADLHALLQEEPSLAGRIVPGAPFCRAEIIHAVREEMARTLPDLLRRRIPLQLVCPPGREVLQEVAHLAGPLLGWSRKRRHQEVDLLADGPHGPPAVQELGGLPSLQAP